jgi:hypothetical protein
MICPPIGCVVIDNKSRDKAQSKGLTRIRFRSRPRIFQSGRVESQRNAQSAGGRGTGKISERRRSRVGIRGCCVKPGRGRGKVEVKEGIDER